MRGQQLTRILAGLRAELSRSTDVAIGTDDSEILIQRLRRTQEKLYADFDWPFLRRVFPPVPLQAGQRYYDLPDKLNVERVEQAAVWYDRRPLPVERGIGFDDYLIFNSDLGDRATPALKWDVRDVDGATQIEIWPLPTDNAQTLQFIGIRELQPFRDGNDLADLDDNLIIGFAAARLLAKAESADARETLTEAQQHYAKLKARATAATPTVRLGMGAHSNARHNRVTVHIAGR